MSQRTTVVVTGMGIASAVGWTLDEVWAAMKEGKSGLKALTLFESQRCGKLLVGQIDGNPAQKSGLPSGSRSDHLAVWAAKQAVADAAIAPGKDYAPSRCAIVLGGLTGGMQHTEDYLVAMHQGTALPAPATLEDRECCNAADRVAELFQIAGFRSTISNACASGGSALALASDLLESGEADVVFAGGVDSLNRVVLNGFNSLMLCSADGARPFDKDRKGMSLGEGAGVLILETLEHAQARGAKVRAVLAGCGNSCDAHHVSAPQPEGKGLQEAMRQALEHARLPPSAVQYVNAHGTGTGDNDPAEARAIVGVFGNPPPAVSSTKRFFGHTLAAAGAIEAIVSILAMERGAVPPNLGLREVDPKVPFQPVSEMTPATIDVAMSTSLGFGGNNSAVVFSKLGGTP